jgi:hypothetical protein
MIQFHKKKIKIIWKAIGVILAMARLLMHNLILTTWRLSTINLMPRKKHCFMFRFYYQNINDECVIAYLALATKNEKSLAV